MKGRLLMRAASGAIAGAGAGLVVGIGARVAMRMVALGLPDGIMQPVTFTAQGTTLILLVGVISGIAFGVVYDVLADRLPGRRPVRGLIFAGLGLLVIGPLLFAQPEEFASQGRVVLFALLFPIFGLTVSTLDPLARRAVDASSRGVRRGLAFLALAAGGATVLAIADGVRSLATGGM